MVNVIFEFENSPAIAKWADKAKYDEAEELFYSKGNHLGEEVAVAEEQQEEAIVAEEPVMAAVITDESEATAASPQLGSLACQIAKARQDIQKSRAASVGPTSAGAPTSAATPSDVINRVAKLEGDNTNLKAVVSSLEEAIKKLTARITTLEDSFCKNVAVAEVKKQTVFEVEEDEDEDEVDLFGSDDEEDDEAAQQIRDKRVADYATKKLAKPGPIAKSSVLLDCKPWDDTTDMKIMETEIRKITKDGLKWGAAQCVPIAYGVQKLSILCIVEDAKVSIDDLTEDIESIEEYVQSVDISAFNKI